MRIEEEAEILSKRANGWAVAAGFTYRALIVPASLTAGWSFVSHKALYLLPPAIFITVANAVLTVVVARGKRPGFLETCGFMYLDVAIAVVVNLVTPLVVATGSILTTGSDVFWYYLLGTVFIWTTLKGPRLGAALVAVGAFVEAAMIVENHAMLTSAALVQALGRVSWLAAGAIVPWVILKSATRGSRIAVAGAAIASHEAERARVFGDLHDIVFQAFGEIARQTARGRYCAELLEGISDFAHEQATDVAREFDQEQSQASSLASSIRALQAEFQQRGLVVHVSTDWTGPEPIDRVRIALTGAAREALNNVLIHSGSAVATITVTDRQNGVGIVVQDSGVGYDAERVTYGLGIPQSIVGRMERVRGSALVLSTPGEGTTVELAAPIGSDDRSDLPELLRSLDSFSADALEDESLGWFAVPALVYRACLTPLQVALAYGTLHTTLSAGLWVAMGFVWMFDLTLLAAAVTGRCVGVFKSIWLFLFDVSLAIGVNVFAVSELPRGTALVPGHEFLWGYTFGTVVLWTALRGVWFGALMIGVSAALEIIIVAVNSIRWSVPVITVFSAQIFKAFTALVLSLLITGLARKGYRLAVAGGSTVGAEHARAEELRSLCDEAVAGLRSIVDICADEALSVKQRMHLVRGVALQSVSHLRRRLAALKGSPSEESAESSRILDTIDEFRRLGLRVEFVPTGSGSQPPSHVAEVLRVRLHAALENALKHSGARHIVVRMDMRSNDGEIVVRDHGVGFEIAGADQGVLREEILAGGRACAGTVETWSEPGGGTRVRIAAQW